jgi:uncharacterized protein (TIGR02145 family)
LSDLAVDGGKLFNWTSGSDTGYYWPGAGTKLKSDAGWYDWDGNNSGNGTDDFGFSALPGGSRRTGGGFYNAGSSGFWWTATEYGSEDAYGRYMNYYYDNVYGYYGDKGLGSSVRCRGD